MKLAQILIQAGVTPIDLHPDCKFIAQDGDCEMMTSQYSDIPEMYITHWMSNGSYLCELFPYLDKISRDWQTALSRADFITAYEKHLMPKAAQPTDAEMLDWLLNQNAMYAAFLIDSREAIAAEMAKEAK